MLTCRSKALRNQVLIGGQLRGALAVQGHILVGPKVDAAVVRQNAHNDRVRARESA
jgi:hypothetical protein